MGRQEMSKSRPKEMLAPLRISFVTLVNDDVTQVVTSPKRLSD